jgi:ubiquinone/menaquinone biosynthesis C-methylase UbiE
MFHRDGPSLAELARQALSSTERGYDLLAPKFDFTPFRTPDAVVVPMAEALGRANHALDLCCGTGAGLLALAPRARSITGIDFSAGMLAEARRRVGRKAMLVRGDARALPFGSVFDLVICVGALGHFVGADQDAFLANIARVLVPGGRFAFVTGGPISPLHPGWWIARGFNAVMHVRNAILKPEFVMFYLTFMLPGVIPQLEKHGFSVKVEPAAFPAPYAGLKLVVATKR